ncbi:hypothetical protein [Demequina activiva]|uniref:Uncharacterized protein n=1 Tax=Demequina activiva TaxID=1582364 RepID=A0A919UKP7_9MICO|nr:hypothetical protein [Demequina activiva]GIG55195.1 hypothetical protein Dac01nite_19470 [Demequina activiva]
MFITHPIPGIPAMPSTSSRGHCALQHPGHLPNFTGVKMALGSAARPGRVISAGDDGLVVALDSGGELELVTHKPSLDLVARFLGLGRARIVLFDHDIARLGDLWISPVPRERFVPCAG